MNMLTSVVARVLFALPFGIFGIFHLINGAQMAAMVPIPGKLFWIYFVGVALIAGSVGIITKIQGKWAALGLALLMLIFIVFIHIPGLGKPALQQIAMISLLKDIALMGGALTYAGILSRAEAK
jgi:putative oxidoreductase